MISAAQQVYTHATPASAPSTVTTNANPAADIDQCTNGQVSPFTIEPCLIGTAISGPSSGTAFSNWVNGNSNGAKSHWKEGEFISYRVTVTNLAPGSHSIVIQYDTVHSGKHAIDYLGSYDATETTSLTSGPIHYNNNNPCVDKLGTTICPQSPTPTPANTFPIPSPLLINCGGSSGTAPSPILGTFDIFGKSGSAITGASYVSQNVLSGTGQCSTSMAIGFTSVTGGSTVVIAWGGHIASSLDWGAGNSASAISGSPYHMALVSLDGASTGSQDRALATSAIFFQPSINTVIYNAATNLPVTGTVPAGTTVYDTATLSNALGSAGGKVFYAFFTNGACIPSPATNESVTVTNALVPNSPNHGPLSAGSYSFRAYYSGDTQDFPALSPCEPLQVGKVTPTITTAVSPATLTLVPSPVSATDTATLSGGVSPTGTIVFRVYRNDATCSAGNLVFTSNTITVTGDGQYTSNAFTPTAAGTYYWIASYSGDTNNQAVATGCGDNGEVLVVQPASPDVTTVVSQSSITLGDSTFSVTDAATLTGAFNPTGSITFTVFDSASCSGTPLFTSTKTVTGNGVYTSDPYTISSVGTYYWIASYSGDSNNNAFATKCGEANEVVHVSPASPTVSTLASPSQFTLTTTSTPVSDTATLSGGFAPSGTIIFTLYFNDATCAVGNLVFTSAAIGVTGNGAYTSTPTYTPTVAGTYYWIAAYSGDTNNDAYTTHCGESGEVLTVLPASPGLTTTASPSAIVLSNAVFTATDTAHLSGGFNPTGSITFTLFNTAGCTGTSLFTNTVSVSGNGDYTSGAYPVTSAGTYYWIAHYSGDGNNVALTTGCGDLGEVLTVSPASPAVTTAVTPSTITLGNAPPYTAFDTATLSGAFAPTGSITFTVFFNDATCLSAPVFTNTVPVSGNGAYPSGTMTVTAAGTYYWVAAYSGDTNNNAFSTSCGESGEVLTVNPAGPTMTTSVSPASFTLTETSTPLTDTATLSGGFNPSGSITFYVYANDATCGAGSLAFTSGPVAVSGNGVYTSAPAFTPNAAGTYYWIASYSGDPNNHGFTTKCGDSGETLTVLPAQPGITTQVSQSSVTLGDSTFSVTDTATLSGAFNPTGSITFTVFNNAGCTGTPLFTNVQPVSGDGLYTSDPFTVPGIGTYKWIAHYSGDANNNAFTTACGESGEVVTVSPASPTMTTIASPSAFTLTTISTPATDTATLTGAFEPTGTITFTLYLNDATCGGGSLVFTSSAIAVSGNAAYTSAPAYTPTAAGTYYWIAAYSGDGNNNPFTTTCGDSNEVLVVSPAAPGVTTTARPSAIVLSNAVFTATDTAHLSGGFNPTGSITFTLFDTTGCSASSIFLSVVPVSGNGDYTSDPFTVPGVGTYYWIAHYSGDANNNAFTTGCGESGEILTVTAASPTVTTAVTPSTITLGGAPPYTAFDTATLSGAFEPTGTITFTVFFNDATCLSAPVFTNTVPVSGNGAYPSGTMTVTAAGTYYWIASYSGDSNNHAFTTKCGDAGEVVTVQAASPSVTTQVSPASIVLGPNPPYTATDTATLTGGFNPTGSIRFTVFNTVGCTGAPLFTDIQPVSGNGAYTSDPFTVPGTGTYYWIAAYSGDPNNNAFTTACGESGETLIVTAASPTATTAVSVESFALTTTSTPVTDTATFTGGFFSPPASPSGTLTFYVYYNDASCGAADLAFTSSPLSVDHNGAYTSNAFTPGAVGTYTWQVVYTGDANNNPFTICGGPHETVTVGAASPTITTALSQETLTLTTASAAVTDTATFSGGFFSPPASPSGTLTFYVYHNDASCGAANLVFTSSADLVNANGAYVQSPAFTPPSVGTYYWVAAYTGDLNNNPFTTPCGANHEVLVVSPASPTATTAVSVESFALTTTSTPVTDTATFSGGYFLQPAQVFGTLTFYVYYNDASCSSNPVFSSGPFTVDHNGNYVSDPFTPSAVGTYTWQIVYTGDLNNVAFTNCGGAHETVTVLPSSPTGTTAVSVESFALTTGSTAVTDTATFSGGFFSPPASPSGTLTFYVYSNDASCGAANLVFTSGSQVVDHNGLYTSNAFTPTAVGTYTWQIVYTGDLNNVAFTICGGAHETVTVTPSSPTATTAVSTESFALTTGSVPVTDTATFTGGFFSPPASPSGTLTFYVYYNDASCGAANLVFTSVPQTVNHNGLYASNAFTPEAVGTYTWQIVYTGDLNNNPFTICGGAHETVTVTPATPSATTAVSIEEFQLTTGSTPVTDTATFVDGYFLQPGQVFGTLTFHVFLNDGTCSGTPVFTSGPFSVSYNGLYTSDPFTPLQVGLYTWQIVYTGDLNNVPFTDCGGAHETVLVTPAAPSGTTALSTESFALTTSSEPVTDTATFSGGFFLQPSQVFGTLTFYVFLNDASCSGTPVFSSGPVVVDHNGLYTSNAFTPLQVGTYTWQIVYTGDLNNVAFTNCGGAHEVLTVRPASPQGSTAVSMESFALTEVSTPVTDTATFSGGFFLQPSQVFGTLTFYVYLNDGSCDSTPVFSAGPIVVDHNGDYVSGAFTPDQVGTYTWQIVYTGDLNNLGFTLCGGAHEVVTVTPASPSATTAVSTESFALTTGSVPVTDTATFSGGFFSPPASPSGTLTFYVYYNDASCGQGNLVFTSSPLSVDHNGAYTSNAFTPLAVGTYTWQIVYTGDLNNKPFVICGGPHETVTVTPASPSATTAVSVESFALTTSSEPVTDTATFSGGFFLQPAQVFGTLTFYVYYNDASCSSNPVFSSGPFTVDHNGNYVSDPFTPLAVGTYTWQIVYTGDLNNVAFTNCGGAHETVTVTPPSPTGTTALSIESFALTTGSTPVTDTATFSGGFFLQPGQVFGTLTFHVFLNDGTCSGLPVFTSGPFTVDHNGLYTSAAFTPLQVGVYTWQLVYTGDLDNNGFSNCGGAHEVLTVTPSSPTATTAVSPETFALTTGSMAVTDTATFSGGFFLQPSQVFGTLTFYVYYNDPSCGGAHLVFTSNALTVDHNGAYTSNAFTPLAVGTYTWQIAYTGDLDNVAFTICGGAHETVTVTPSSPTGTTALSLEAFDLTTTSTPVTDTATFAGGYFLQPGQVFGTLTFRVYRNDGSCTSTPVFTSGPFTVDHNGNYVSGAFTADSVGTYTWQIVYTGDLDNNGFSNCGGAHEVLTVSPAHPSVSTVASPASLVLGDDTFTATDTASLGGGFAPTGDIVFNVFNSAGCTGSAIFTSTVSVDGNGAYTSGPFTIPAAGTYYWIASYSGDPNNLPFTTGCGDPGEVLLVLPAPPTVVTQVSSESITLSEGTFSVTDTATLSGGFQPLGSITFRVFNSASCSGTPLFTDVVSVDGNGGYTSGAFTIPAAGTYYWIASYSGDANNNAFTTGCGDDHEVVTVSPASPDVVTAVSTASITLANSAFQVTDTATLSGGFAPTGSIVFSVFDSAGCTGSAVFSSTVSVDGNGDYTSAAFTIPAAGTYFWIAHYSGDANNHAFTTGCGDANEVVTVSPASPRVVTQVSEESITLGDATFSVTDTATLSGGFEPTGSLVFRVYDSGACTGTPIFSSTVSVDGNGDYTSAAFTIPAAGTYYWIAAYSGDANNVAFTTGCGDAHEVVTVAKAPPRVTTAVSAESITLGDGTFQVTDTATLSGGFEPTGSIGFSVFDNAGCTGNALFTSTISVDGNGGYTSGAFTIPAAGTYYWIASYSGDANNLPFTTGCGDAHEVVTVSPASPNVITALSEESVVLTDATFSVTDTASLSGGFAPTGTITFTVFQTAGCTGTPLFTDIVSVSGNGDYTSDPFTVPGIGTYKWIAHYSGDGNNHAFTTGCGDANEVLTVTPASPGVTTALSTEGFDIPTHSTAVTDTATLTGGFDPTGTIRFFVFLNSPTCVGSPVFTSDLIPVDGNGPYTSTPGFTPTQEGTYYWIAAYSGDANNVAFTTGCGDAHEVLTITLSPGTIIVNKVALGGDGTFGYTTTGGSALPASFDVATSGGAGGVTFTGIDVHHTYSVAETGLPANWIPLSVSCSDGTNTLANTGFLVPAGGTVTCTFTNARLAQLIVIKHVDNGALPAGAIAKSASDFTMLVTAVNPSSSGFPGEESPGVTVNAEAGAYSVTENPLNPAYTNAFFETTYTATFSGCTGTLDWGETATCTITNTGTAEEIPSAQLIVRKVALGGDGTFTYALTGPSVPSILPATVSITTSGGTGQYPTSTVPILHGTYTITENPTAGFTLVSVVCTVNGGAPIPESNGLSIDVPLGAVVVCTFTNTRSFGQITDTMFCPFDTDSGVAGQQFNVLFQRSGGTYKISSTNPGQFYYNVFFYGTPGSTATITVTLPWPFVTQGAQPVHVYSGFGVSNSGCLQQFDDVSSTFTMHGPSTTPSGGPAILLSDYAHAGNGNTASITLTGPVPSTGLAYVTVHIMWGLNGTGGWQPQSPCSGGCVADALNTNGLTLPNNHAYGFAWSESGTGTSISNTVYNKNVFKN